jgi:hypothetical protein
LIKHFGGEGGEGEAGGFFVANSGYFTVFTPHIYFIIPSEDIFCSVSLEV